MVQGDGVEGAPQAQNDITPALTTRWAMVELPQEAPELRLLGVELFDPCAGEPIQDPELLLPQPFVNNEGVLLGANATFRLDQLGRVPGPQVRGCEDDIGPLRGREAGEPASEDTRLLLTEGAQGDVDVTIGYVDVPEPCSMSGIASDVAGAFPVTHDPKAFRPPLMHRA
jgi:hypothetical protein